LIHAKNSAVRLLEYRIKYGQSNIKITDKGGVGTILIGLTHFTSQAESHKGYCHGGSMCSVMDDIIGWTGFCVSGKCVPWSGFTAQVNTKLINPIPVNTILKLSCRIIKVEKRKVFLKAELVDPVDPKNEKKYCEADGLVILKKA